MALLNTFFVTNTLILTTVFISLSGFATANDERKCYWCGPLSEQVHRSRRAPSCDQNNLLQTSCDEGYTHCAIVATSPPYVESRLCVKFYQDECYSLYCNSTQTWRMVCPCRGDLCNGANTERERSAFSTLTRTVKKNKPRNKRTSSSFINIRTRARNETNITISNEIDENEISNITTEMQEPIVIVNNITLPSIDLKHDEETTIVHESTVLLESTVSAESEDKTISVDIENKIDINVATLASTSMKNELSTEVDIITESTPIEKTSIQIELLIQNEIKKDTLPPAEALQENVTPTKIIEMTTMAQVDVTTMQNDISMESTTDSTELMNKNLSARNIVHFSIIIFAFFLHI